MNMEWSLVVVVLCACAAAGAASEEGPEELADTPPSRGNLTAAPAGPVRRVGPGRPDIRIVGGLPCYRGEHPYMAGLIIDFKDGAKPSYCGGSLVAPARVLTAAACYKKGLDKINTTLVVLDSLDLFSNGTRVLATNVTVHPDYKPEDYTRYNIAVVKIPTQTITEYVKPILMARGSEQYAVGYLGQAIGYGPTSDSKYYNSTGVLREVFVDVISDQECTFIYSEAMEAGIICTSGVGGRNPCGADQGGPLVIPTGHGHNLLLGVNTFGSGKGCEAGMPAVYTRVSHYYEWVLSLI